MAVEGPAVARDAPEDPHDDERGHDPLVDALAVGEAHRGDAAERRAPAALPLADAQAHGLEREVERLRAALADHREDEEAQHQDRGVAENHVAPERARVDLEGVERDAIHVTPYQGRFFQTCVKTWDVAVR